MERLTDPPTMKSEREKWEKRHYSTAIDIPYYPIPWRTKSEKLGRQGRSRPHLRAKRDEWPGPIYSI